MSENDPLRSVLREWKAPEPSEALDERVRGAFRVLRAPSLWAWFLRARVSVPVPVLAAVVLLIAVACLLGKLSPCPKGHREPNRAQYISG
jgi:hypothetical protein